MKKVWNDPRFVFTALQACGVIALLPVIIALAGAAEGVVNGEALGALRLGFGAVCWSWMWMSFLRMCGRLKREPSAFTERNAHTLKVIAVCCGLLGALMIGEAAAQPLTRGVLLGGWMGSLATVAMFFGVAAVALVLRRLLISAMALQQDNDLTI